MECNVVARYLRNVELTPREVGRTILVEHCWYHEIVRYRYFKSASDSGYKYSAMKSYIAWRKGICKTVCIPKQMVCAVSSAWLHKDYAWFACETKESRSIEERGSTESHKGIRRETQNQEVLKIYSFSIFRYQIV